MKSIITEPANDSYPRLKENKDGNMVVLFISEKSGTVVWSSDKAQLGMTNQNWIPSAFRQTNKEITLSDD